MDFIFNEKDRVLLFTGEISGQEIKLFYREPEASEKIKYRCRIASFYRGKEIEEIPAEEIQNADFEFGLSVLKGIEANGIPINISSDPESSDFDSEWKEKISKRAPELIIWLGAEAFGGGSFSPEKK